MSHITPGCRTAQYVATFLALVPGTVSGAQAPPERAAPQPSPMVWVNLSSRVYHCPGTQYYANTTRGDSMPEMAARARGYRASRGSGCTPAKPDAPIRADSGQPILPRGATERCVIEQVTDGDTIRCRVLGRVRLIGVDAAEVRTEEPFASRSTAALRTLAAVGDTVLLEFDVGRLDTRGRTLAYLWKGGKQINWELVRQGFAVAWKVSPNERYYPSLVRAERLAREAKAGLWVDDRFRCLPLARRPGC
ncbi:MAG: thermonuclease family protein [Gemmatimonadota bacterium]